MVNKKFWLGMLVMALVFGIVVVSCDNGTTIDKVSITSEKAPQVSSVTVTKTTNNQHFIVSWDAIEGEGNGYTVYFKQDGKKSSTSVSGAQNLYKYDPATGDQIPNDDLDKWSCRVSSLNNLVSAAGSYCFGVRSSIPGSSILTNASSDIKWANSFTITAGPQMSAITVTKTTTGNYLISSWDAVAGIDAYKVVLYYLYSNGSWYEYASGEGQNSQTYDESNGTPITNTDPSKWSYIRNTSTSYDGYYFTVSPVVSDISVLPSSTTTPIIKWN